MAGLTPSVSSPFGNKPQDLESPQAPMPQPAPMQPQPDIGGVGNILSGQTSVGQMIPPEPAAPAVPSVDELWEQMQAADSMSTEPAPSGISSAIEQLREAPARFKYAWTVGPNEALSVAQQYFPEAKLDEKGETVLVKRPGRTGWEPLDRKGFQILGDSLDLTRDVFEGIVEKGAQVGAATAGSVLPGAGTLAGAAAGGATGALVAKNAGDWVSQNLVGIKRDPNRNALFENAVTATFGAGLGTVGSVIGRRVAARKLVAEADKSVAGVMKRVGETMEDIQTVRDSGIKIDPANGKFMVDPNVATGGADPEIRARAKALSEQDGYRNFFNEMGDSLKNAYMDVADRVASFAGKKRLGMGEDFVLTAKDVRQAEGRLIGSFRRMADEKLAGQPQLAPRFTQTLQAMAMELPQSVDDLALAAGVTPSQARQLKGLLTNYGERLRASGGGLTVDEMGQFNTQLTGIINANMNSVRGRPLAYKLMDLRNSVRDDWTDAIGNVLPPQKMQMYQDSLSRYRDIMGATDSLGRMLDSENISKDVLVAKLFEGKGSYEFMKSAKTLIEETNPELWQNLSAEYFQRLKRMGLEEVVEKGADGVQRTSQNFNWGRMAKSWKGLDERVRDELSSAVGVKREGIDALMNLGIKYQNADVGFMTKEPQRNFILKSLKNAFSFFMGGGAAKGTASANVSDQLMDAIGKDGALMRFLQAGDNMEALVRELKHASPDAIARFRNRVANFKPMGMNAPERMVGIAEELIEKGSANTTGAKAVRQQLQTTGRRREEEKRQ